MPFSVQVQRNDITRDPSKLHPITRRFHDPLDRKTAITIAFKSTDITIRVRNFCIEWVRRSMMRATGVKALTLVPDMVEYLTNKSSEDILLHGHALTIYERTPLIPINQSIPIGTTYDLLADAENSSYAITILSGHIKPTANDTKTKDVTKSTSDLPLYDDELLIKGEIPFNRRIELLHLLPGESISARFSVQVVSDLSLRETDWIGRPADDTLIILSRLGKPADRLVSEYITRALAAIESDDTVSRVENMGFNKSDLIALITQLGKVIITACEVK